MHQFGYPITIQTLLKQAGHPARVTGPGGRTILVSDPFRGPSICDDCYGSIVRDSIPLIAEHLNRNFSGSREQAAAGLMGRGLWFDGGSGIPDSHQSRFPGESAIAGMPGPRPRWLRSGAMGCLASLYAHLALLRGNQPQDIAIYQESAIRKKVWFGGDSDGRKNVFTRELVTTIRGWTFTPTDTYENNDILVVDAAGAHGYARSSGAMPDGLVISYYSRANDLLEELKGARPGWDMRSVTSTTLMSKVDELLNRN